MMSGQSRAADSGITLALRSQTPDVATILVEASCDDLMFSRLLPDPRERPGGGAAVLPDRRLRTFALRYQM